VYLPNRELAQVPEKKLREYLLSMSHPVGHAKARFFLSIGFSPDRWEVLSGALLRHAVELEVVQAEPNRFGTRYLIEGRLASPDGRDPRVRSVWFIETGEVIPRFVTAYPVSKEKP
jgi:hypothetical protein